MRALTDADVLRLWEAGLALAPLDRGLALLHAAGPEASGAQLAGLPAAERDRRLLLARALTFGEQAAAFARCPECDAELEVPFSTEALLRDAPGIEPDQTWEAEVDGHRVVFRLPTSLDIAAAVASQDDPAAALARRCLQGPDDTPDSPSFLAALERAMVAAHPHVEPAFGLVCPDCGHEWTAVLDIGSFFWAEIAREARQLVYEVHTLARSYGWREADILGLTRPRRHAYLEMALG